MRSLTQFFKLVFGYLFTIAAALVPICNAHQMEELDNFKEEIKKDLLLPGKILT